MSLVEIIELKWLLAGEGVHVHVEKLQQDGVYARKLLHDALGSANYSVRDAASKLLQRLQPA